MRKVKTIIFILLLAGLMFLAVFSACKKAPVTEPVETAAEVTEISAQPTATPYLYDKEAEVYWNACTAYYENSDAKTAYSLLKDYAQTEYAPIRELLGTLIYNGLGADMNQLSAVEHLSYAAEQDNALALYMLGEISRTNTILGVDENAAADYYKKALPLLEEAYKEYPDSKDSGRVVIALANLYENGFGTDSNPDKAIDLRKEYIQKTSANPLYAYRMLAAIEEEGGANELYASLFQKILSLANEDNTEAIRDISNYYYSGDGEISQDFISSFEWLLKAAELGDPIAQNDLAILYQDGIGTEKDINKAVEWFTKAVEQNFAIAEYNLANLLCADNEELEKDPDTAVKLLKSAADKNYVPAQNRLGLLLQDQGNYEEAFGWFEKAASAKNVYAIYNLAVCYISGDGVEQNAETAYELLKTARDMGHSGAADMIIDKGLE